MSWQTAPHQPAGDSGGHRRSGVDTDTDTQPSLASFSQTPHRPSQTGRAPCEPIRGRGSTLQGRFMASLGTGVFTPLTGPCHLPTSLCCVPRLLSQQNLSFPFFLLFKNLKMINWFNCVKFLGLYFAITTTPKKKKKASPRKTVFLRSFASRQGIGMRIGGRWTGRWEEQQWTLQRGRESLQGIMS